MSRTRAVSIASVPGLKFVADLSDEHTQAVVDSLLPTAHQLTTAQLIQQIQRHAIALDPNWARRRYEKALLGRRVVGSRNSDGGGDVVAADDRSDV